jgi:hypothetical protein
MRYWIFVNDNVLGPLNIKEIINRSYFDEDLLVCPYEMDGVKPSNWYFVKELPEFEKYFNRNVIVDEINIDEIINSVSSIEENRNKDNLDEVIGEKEVLKENIEIKEREIQLYKDKISYLESRIDIIEKNLDRATNLIQRYENKLFEKDSEIKILSEGIRDVKKDAEQTDLAESKKTDEKPVVKENDIKTIEKKDEILLNKETDFGKISEVEANSYDENTSVQSIYESDKETTKNDRTDGVIAGGVDENNNHETIIKENVFETNVKDEGKPEREEEFDTFSGPVRDLSRVDMNLDSSDDSAVAADVDIDELKLDSFKEEATEDKTGFQFADIKLEPVKTNMDVVESKNIEELNYENKKNDEPQEEKKDVDPLLSQNLRLTPPKRFVKPVAVVNAGDKENSSDSTMDTVTPDIALENSVKNKNDKTVPTEPSVNTVNASDKEIKPPDNKIDLSQGMKKKKSSGKFKVVIEVLAAILFVALFAVSIMYILRSDSKSNQSYATPKFPKEEAVADSKGDAAKKQSTVSSDIDIAKINDDVKKAIDVVKNYQLGSGKGSIGNWFSNTFSASNQVREEWNATYLSGDLFVVQYRVLRYKSEPIVYLFEVDVKKNKIIRGINNNAIELLSGSVTTKKVISKKNKKIAENMDKDDEMF